MRLTSMLIAAVAAACGLFGLAGVASAQWAGAIRGGTTGFGGELGYSLNPQVGLRGAWHGGSISNDVTESGVRYDGKWDFGTALALVDFHPGRGAFRLSAGLGYNRNKLDLTASGTSGTIEINGRTYNIADVGTVRGSMRFNRTNPYFGVGWGSASKVSQGEGLFFSADLGVLFVKPDVNLAASCGPTLSAAQCSQFQADLRAEERSFEDSTGFRSLYPVLSFGIGYRF
jgi:hypothetical protein